MIKKMLTLIIIGLMLTAGIVCGLPQTKPAMAEAQSITYVAFGDSIAEGYAINLKSREPDEDLVGGADEDYSFTQGSYGDLIKQELEKKYNVTGFNFAYSGDTCQDLIDYLNEFYDYELDKAKDGNDANSTYPTLSNQSIYQSVHEANIITICIGANNVLGEAPNLISRFLGLTEPSITRQEMESALKDKILGSSEKDIRGLTVEFEELLQILNKLNPNAKIYFTNVYNPFKVLDAQESALSLCQLLYPKMTQENFNIISEITEIVVNGGKDSEDNDFVGVNNVIKEKIDQYNAQNNSNRFIYVDTKASFDEKYDSTSKETRKEYNNYVNVRLDEITQETISSMVSSGNFDANKITKEYLDPHPTYQGHELIFSTYKNVGLEVYLPIPTITIKFVTNCEQSLQSETIDAGTKISKPNIKRDGYLLKGWFTDENFVNEWNFDDVATENMTLYAKWEKPNYLPTILIICGATIGFLILAIIVKVVKNKKSVF